MKKIVKHKIKFILVILTMLPFVCFGSWWLHGQVQTKIELHQSFSLDKRADFYLIFKDAIGNYKLKDGNVEHLKTEKINVGRHYDMWPWAVEKGNRYFMFPEGGSFSSRKDFNIVVLDFKKQKLDKFPNPDAEPTAVGTDGTNFYSGTSRPEGSKIYQYSPEGKVLNTYTFEKGAIIDSFMWDGQYLYALASQDLYGNVAYESTLLKFDKNLKLLEMKIFDDEKPLTQYLQAVLINDKIYMVDGGAKDLENGTFFPTKRVAVVNKNTLEIEEHLNLEENYLYQVVKDVKQEHIIIAHEPSKLRKNVISILNVKNREVITLDINDYLKENSVIDETNIVALQTDDKDNLYIVAGDRLLIYDMDAKEWLSKTKIEGEAIGNLIGIWIKK